MGRKPHADAEPRPGILLTGACGYVGGRLLGRLEARGHAVRRLVFAGMLRGISKAARDGAA